MHIIAGLIALGLLITFPRTTIGVAALVVLAFGLFLWRDSVDADRRTREANQVVVKAYPTIPAPGCPEGFPISVAFSNGTQRTIASIDWRLHIRRKGYSADLVDYLDSSRTSDKILKPNEIAAFCYAVPKLSLPIEAPELDITAERIYSTFAE